MMFRCYRLQMWLFRVAQLSPTSLHASSCLVFHQEWNSQEVRPITLPIRAKSIEAFLRGFQNGG